MQIRWLGKLVTGTRVLAGGSWLLRGVAVFSFVAVLVCAGWWMFREMRRVPGPLAQLPQGREVEALLYQFRTIEPRSSLVNTWRPRVADRPLPSTLRAIQIDKNLEQVAHDREDVPVLLARGAVLLVLGEPARAVEILERAASMDPNHAAVQNELSAALLTLGTSTGQPAPIFVRALDAAAKAVRLGGGTPAAFNRGLALEALVGPDAVDLAWQPYLAEERDLAWRQEVERRVANLTAVQKARSWQSNRDLLIRAPPDWRAADVAPILDGSHQDVREWIEDRWLLDWAEAEVASSSEATPRLAQIRWLTDALRVRTGDALTAEGVAAIERTAPGSSLRRALVEGHRQYGRGRAFAESDQRSAAESAFAAAAVAFDSAGSPFAVAARLQQAVLLYQRRQYDASREMLTTIGSTPRLRGYRAVEGRAEWISGTVAMRASNPGDALPHYLAALHVFEQLQEYENVVGLNNAIADAYRVLGDTASGWKYLRAALLGLAGPVRPTRRYIALLNASLFALRDGLVDASLDFQNSALHHARRADIPGPVVEGLARRSVVLAQAARYDEAQRDIDEGRKLLPQVIEAAQRAYFGAWLDSAQGTLLVATRPMDAAGPLRTALRFFTSAESAETPRLHLLAGRAALATGNVTAADASFTTGISAFEQRRRRLPDEDLRLSYFDEAWDLYAEKARLALRGESHSDDAFVALESARARTLSEALGLTRVLSPAEACRRLVHDEQVLVYSLLPDRLLTWSLSRKGQVFSSQDIERHTLEQQIRRYLSALERGDRADANVLSTVLHDTLIAPHVARLGPGAPVVIVADGAIALVPFTTLRDRRTERYLVEDHPLLTAPSVSAYQASTESGQVVSSPRVLLLGNPRINHDVYPQLALLPDATREISELESVYGKRAEVLLGDGATGTALLDAAGQYAVVHFAGHAFANEELPSLSQLVMAPTPARASGAVFGYEIGRRDWRGTKLVVLGACRTGRGPIRRGEGVLNLARPFLARGALTVLATGWDIRDAEAREMSSRFHAALADGASPVVALQRAQLSLLSSGDHGPSSWGAVIAIGSQAAFEPVFPR